MGVVVVAKTKDKLIDLLLEQVLEDEKPAPPPQPEKRGIDPLTAIALLGIAVIVLAIASYPSTVGSGIPVQQGGGSGVTAK